MRREVGEVVTRPLLLGGRVADDRDAREAREARAERAGLQPKPRERRGTDAREQEVGRGEELVERRAAGGCPQVESVNRAAGGQGHVPRRRGDGERVALGRLDLRHRCAQLAQARRRDGSGNVRRDGDDADPGKGRGGHDATAARLRRWTIALRPARTG